MSSIRLWTLQLGMEWLSTRHCSWMISMKKRIGNTQSRYSDRLCSCMTFGIDSNKIELTRSMVLNTWRLTREVQSTRTESSLLTSNKLSGQTKPQFRHSKSSQSLDCRLTSVKLHWHRNSSRNSRRLNTVWSLMRIHSSRRKMTKASCRSLIQRSHLQRTRVISILCSLTVSLTNTTSDSKVLMTDNEQEICGKTQADRVIGRNGGQHSMFLRMRLDLQKRLSTIKPKRQLKLMCLTTQRDTLSLLWSLDMFECGCRKRMTIWFWIKQAQSFLFFLDFDFFLGFSSSWGSSSTIGFVTSGSARSCCSVETVSTSAFDSIWVDSLILIGLLNRGQVLLMQRKNSCAASSDERVWTSHS